MHIPLGEDHATVSPEETWKNVPVFIAVLTFGEADSRSFMYVGGLLLYERQSALRAAWVAASAGKEEEPGTHLRF